MDESMNIMVALLSIVSSLLAFFHAVRSLLHTYNDKPDDASNEELLTVLWMIVVVLCFVARAVV